MAKKRSGTKKVTKGTTGKKKPAASAKPKAAKAARKTKGAKSPKVSATKSTRRGGSKGRAAAKAPKRTLAINKVKFKRNERVEFRVYGSGLQDITIGDIRKLTLDGKPFVDVEIRTNSSGNFFTVIATVPASRSKETLGDLTITIDSGAGSGTGQSSSNTVEVEP